MNEAIELRRALVTVHQCVALDETTRVLHVVNRKSKGRAAAIVDRDGQVYVAASRRHDEGEGR